MKIECDTYDFAERLTDLRIQKGVSARDMSLSMGQTSSYINNIENKSNLPSMKAFLFVSCFKHSTLCKSESKTYLSFSLIAQRK